MLSSDWFMLSSFYILSSWLPSKALLIQHFRKPFNFIIVCLLIECLNDPLVYKWHITLSLSSCRGVCMLTVNHPLTPKSPHLCLEWTVDGDIEWLQYASGITSWYHVYIGICLNMSITDNLNLAVYDIYVSSVWNNNIHLSCHHH